VIEENHDHALWRKQQRRRADAVACMGWNGRHHPADVGLACDLRHGGIGVQLANRAHGHTGRWPARIAGWDRVADGFVFAESWFGCEEFAPPAPEMWGGFCHCSLPVLRLGRNWARNRPRCRPRRPQLRHAAHWPTKWRLRAFCGLKLRHSSRRVQPRGLLRLLAHLVRHIFQAQILKARPLGHDAIFKTPIPRL
jgi:hypothetical protein